MTPRSAKQFLGLAPNTPKAKALVALKAALVVARRSGDDELACGLSQAKQALKGERRCEVCGCPLAQSVYQRRFCRTHMPSLLSQKSKRWVE